MTLPSWLRKLPFPTPLKHAAGSAWHMKGRLLAAGSIAAFGLSVFVGALSAIDSVARSRDHWYAQGHLADLELRVVADDIRNFPLFDDVEGVRAFRTRMAFPGRLEREASRHVQVLFIAALGSSSEPINSRQILEGEALDPGDPDGVVIDRAMARYQHHKVGDPLRVKLGNETVQLTIRGIASDAEFLLAPANPSLFVPSKGSLGIVYGNASVLSSRFGFELANSVLFRIDPDADIEAVRQRVMSRAQTRLNVEWSIARHEQFSYRFLEKNLDVFRIMVPAIVLVSALSAIFVTLFLFVQWISRERKSIGVYRSLGHGGAPIAMAFVAMFVLVSGGTILGGLALSVPLGIGFARNFAESIGLPEPQLTLTSTWVAWGIVGIVVVFAIAGFVAIYRTLRLEPRDAMRLPLLLESRPGGTSTRLGRAMPTVWLRMSLRNVLRNRSISSMTLISVALGAGVTAAFFIAFSSVTKTSVERVEQNTWDLAVDFVAPVWDEGLAEFLSDTGVTTYASYTKGVAQTVMGEKRLNLYIGGFDPTKLWHVVALTAGRDLASDAVNGLLLEQSTARELDLKVGDVLTLEMQGRELDVHVRGLFSGALPGEARLTLAAHRVLADLEERTTGLLVRTSGDPDSVAAKLRAHSDVRQVLTKRQVTDEILAASGQVTRIIELGAIVSVLIAALFVFACVGYTVHSRREEYQTLRMLGHRNRVILGIVVAEVVFLGIAALALAVPVGAVTASFLNARLTASWFEVQTMIAPLDYMKSFLPSLLLLPLVAIPIASPILREDLALHIRSREIS